MTPQIALVVGIGIGMLTLWAPAPVRLNSLVAARATQHEEHHPGTAATPDRAAPAPQGNMMMGNMMAADAKLDELVKKMNEAKGQAKTDAIAEVVTALVQQHRTMHAMMADRMGTMSGMTNMPGGPGPGGATPAQPEK